MLFTKPVRLAYCDYIATVIQTNLLENDLLHYLDTVGRVKFTVDFNDKFCTTKTIDVLDVQGKQYRITIQEL
jgi:hypothetical protein